MLVPQYRLDETEDSGSGKTRKETLSLAISIYSEFLSSGPGLGYCVLPLKDILKLWVFS